MIRPTLDELAIKYSCDKSSVFHDYCKTYDIYLSELRDKPINFLELGYGGYEEPDKGGESARMWREYFTKANIKVVDINHKNNIPEGVDFINCSQTDIKLKDLEKQTVILDDASHINSLTIGSFKLLWYSIESGGYYIIEDLHSSYHYPYYSDANQNPEEGNTTMNFIKGLLDEVNSDFIMPKYRKGYDIEFIHMYRDMVIIKKK